MRKGDIPPAFDLRKYDACSTWKPNMWLSALLARRSRGYRDIVINNIGENCRKSDPEFPSIKPAPHLWHAWSEFYKSSADWFLNNPSGTLELYVSGSFIDDQRNIDLLEVCFLTDFKEEGGQPGEIGKEWIDAIEGAYHQFNDSVEPQHRNLASFYQWAIGTKNPFLLASSTSQRDLFGSGPGQFFMGDRHFIGIDLNTSDAILISEFKDWLGKKRSEAGICKHKEITNEHLQRFANLKLLPYLDLHFWEITNEVKIPDSTIAAALEIPPNQPQEQYVKNTLRREAREMIDDLTFFGLRGLAWKQAKEEGGCCD